MLNQKIISPFDLEENGSSLLHVSSSLFILKEDADLY
jgi:hypothetical protein